MSMGKETVSAPRPLFRLPCLQSVTSHTFSIPAKRIENGDDLNFFFTSLAYRDLMTWLIQLDRAMFPSKLGDGQITQYRLDASPPFPDHVEKIRNLLTKFSGLIREAPPDTGPRRFGNVAFRAWVKLVEHNAASLLRESLDDILDTSQNQLIDELVTYLLGSFGSAQRLDYGTGHELNFLAFLGCLWKLGLFTAGEEQAVVLGIVEPYLRLVRQLIMTYTLEPAGSHGVWGLDDHSFLPYIFGSAQLGPAFRKDDMGEPIPAEGSLRSAPKPALVTDESRVADYKDSNMYFAAIQFIYDVKRGPFWEHSPVLYDVSGIKDGWGKINKGMLKMYAAEVLGKFPVVQHFPFGSLFRWEEDPDAEHVPMTIHAQRVPSASASKDFPSSAASSTKAPWAGTASSIQATTPVAPSRAPWVTGGVPAGLPKPAQATMQANAAPWRSERAAHSMPKLSAATRTGPKGK